MGEEKTSAQQPVEEGASAAGLEMLLEFIRDARGFDFTGYKRTSLARRIRKRMDEVGIRDWSDYRDRLETDADEFRALFNTILINVTSFFRDGDAWRHLQEEVLPDLLGTLGEQEEVRVWSAGCSSGEEPYSLAILLAEALGLEACLDRVKIYATDVDEEALQQARSGVYSAKAIERVPPELRARYFEPAPGGFLFRPDLRRRVIFGRHDITRDAPISRLDLLVCRNTLMYFNVETQSQIIERLHFALKEGGYLFLGKAEMLLSDSDRFEVLNMRQRLFRRLPGRPSGTQLAAPLRLEPASLSNSNSVLRKRQLRDNVIESTPMAMVVIDNDGRLGATSAAARLQFGLSVHDLGRPFSELELSYRPVEVRSLIEKANLERRTIRLGGVEARGASAADSVYVDVVVQPLTGDDGQLLGTSLSYLDVTQQVRLQLEVKRVREDLETAYEELQSTNEELETTNEELQSSIEELETTNEELQSTNEELETTNEELQSGNEELETMNEELRTRTDELDETRTFLESVLGSIAAGVVVVDAASRVRGWNAAAEELWGLRSSEVLDEPFFELDFGLPVAEVRGTLEQVQSTHQGVGPLRIAAVNRKGRAFECAVTCTPLKKGGGGVVVLMEPGELR